MQPLNIDALAQHEEIRDVFTTLHQRGIVSDVYPHRALNEEGTTYVVEFMDGRYVYCKPDVGSLRSMLDAVLIGISQAESA